MFDVRLFFCVSAANEAASDFVGCCFLLSVRNEEVIVFESQASVSPQRKKLAHQHRSRAVYSIFDHHPDSFTLFVGICRNRMGKSQRDHEGCLQTDPRHFHDCSHRYGRSRIADDEFFRSGRTVDESRAWLKRIIITWAVLNGLGFIMSYVTPFFSGGQWTAP